MSYLVHGLKRLLHLTGGSEAGRGPWSECEDDRSLVAKYIQSSHIERVMHDSLIKTEKGPSVGDIPTTNEHGQAQNREK